MASEKTNKLDSNQMSGKKKNWDELKPEEMLRGSSLPDVEQRCLKLCAEYIGGAWSLATNPAKDITVKRIAGGLTNQLYYVGLADHVTKQSNNRSVYTDEPREVTIKFYQSKHFRMLDGKNERLSDTIIGLLSSQLKIGPKIYGIFDGGIIQSYFKHVHFKAKQQQNDQLLRQLMHKLARINLLEVPIPKQNKSFKEFWHTMINAAYADLNIRQKIIEFDYELMKKHDPLEEMKNFWQTIESVGSPLVFCHNDFRSQNIMTTGEPGKEKLVVCDFEYGCYGLRGFDIGSILLEWGQNDWSREAWQRWQIPPRDILEKVACFYLEGCDLVRPGYSLQPGNSINDVIRDAKLGTMQNAMFFVVFLINTRESFIDAIEFDLKTNLEMTELSYQLYWKAKQQLIEDGIIPESN